MEKEGIQGIIEVGWYDFSIFCVAFYQLHVGEKVNLSVGERDKSKTDVSPLNYYPLKLLTKQNPLSLTFNSS